MGRRMLPLGYRWRQHADDAAAMLVALELPRIHARAIQVERLVEDPVIFP